MRVALVVVVVAVVVGVAAFGLRALQRRLIFYPEVLPDDATFAFAAPFSERWFVARDGRKLHALRFTPPNGVGGADDRAILYFHGNAGSVASWGNVGVDLAAFGYVVYVVDYAGYGKSRGTPDEGGILDDAEVVYREVRREHPHVVLFGRSLGSGVAVSLAATFAEPGAESPGPPEMLVLETPYKSLVDVAHRVVPWLPSSLMLFPFRSDERIGAVRCPVHVFHGTNDTVIPLASAQELIALGPLPAGSSVTIVDGGGHNDLARFAAYRDALAAILRSRPEPSPPFDPAARLVEQPTPKKLLLP